MVYSIEGYFAQNFSTSEYFLFFYIQEVYTKYVCIIVMMSSSSCKDRCKLARVCDRHQCNRPDPRVRDQRYEKFEPELERDCRGFVEIYDDTAAH